MNSLDQIIDPELEMVGTLLLGIIGLRFRLNHHHVAGFFRHRLVGFFGLEVPVVDRRLWLVAGCSPPAVVNALFLDDFLAQAAIFLGVRQHFPDFLLSEADHQDLVPPPEAVVGLVLEHGQLGHLLPAEPVVLCYLQQHLVHFESPHVFSDGRVDEVTVPFSNLQFVLDLHLRGDQAPALGAEVFDKDDEHECLSGSPSSGGEVGLHSVVIFIVDLFGQSILKELVDLLPVLSIQLLLFQQQLILLQVEQPFGLFFAPEVHNSAVELHAVPELGALAHLAKIHATQVVGQLGQVYLLQLSLFGPIQFLDELALTISIVVLVLGLQLFLADLHLFLEGGGHVALEAYVAEEAGGRRVPDLELVGGDELLEQPHAVPYGVLQDWIHAWLPFIFYWAWRLSIRLIFSYRRRQLSYQGGGIVL